MLEHSTLWHAYWADRDDVAARNALLVAYLPLLRRAAHKLAQRLPAAIDEDDLVQEGLQGLLAAIPRFDPARGYKFATFCALRVRGAMIDFLRDTDTASRLTRQRAKQLHAVADELRGTLGRTPSDDELAAALGVTPSDMLTILRDERRAYTSSLSKPVWETDSERQVLAGDLLTGRASDEPMREARRLERLRQYCRGLNKSERLIVILYHYEGLTMKEIGRTLGLHESRVCQMHGDILRRIRARMKESA